MTKEELISELHKRDIEIEKLISERKNTLEAQLELIKEKVVTYSDNLELTRDLHKNKLTNEDISRYSRQLILPELGPSNQLKLCNSSVLIIGCGGLGCPAAVYLAAAGVGLLGLVDYDEVEISNLHRQILHSEEKVGVCKATSIAHYIQSLNSQVKTKPYHLSLDSSNALKIISNYDIVLDCSDNVATRYLLNDACILAKKPLVSGSALRFEGQLTVYNYESGPCYRCLFPKPPPVETVTNCSDGGVLGVVPGIIGSLQALEAIKVICGIGTPLAQKLLLFDAVSTQFRSIKLRPKQDSCQVCGKNPSIRELIDYEEFCGAKASDKDKNLELLCAENRITPQKYESIMKGNIPHLLLDVRLPVELEICSLPNSVNIPIKDIDNDDNIKMIREKVRKTDAKVVYCLCRRGNDSQIAVSKLLPNLQDLCYVKDIIGGLYGWAKNVDNNFPVY